MNNDFQWSDELVVEFVSMLIGHCATSDDCKRREQLLNDFKRLRNPELKKESLFKTEDGVEVPYGSYIIMLDTQSWSHSYVRIISNQQIKDRFKFFSTREEAEDYILMNKPVHSVNDVMKLCDPIKFHNRNHDRSYKDYSAIYVSLLEEKLIESAKSKITNP